MIPPDELFSREWHLYLPQRFLPSRSRRRDLRPDAWDLTRGRRDVVVAVADDGFDLTHPDFQGDGKVVRDDSTPRRGANSARSTGMTTSAPDPAITTERPASGVAVAEG